MARPGTVPAVVGGAMLFLFSWWLMFSAIFLLVGGIFALVFPLVFGLPLKDLELDKQAWTTDGTITEVVPTPDFVVNSEPTVRLSYVYDAGDGEREGSIQVRQSHVLALLAVDDSATVEYLPADPGVSRLAGGKFKVAGWGGAAGLGFGALGLLMTLGSAIPCLAGLVLLIWGLRRRGRSPHEEASAA